MANLPAKEIIINKIILLIVSVYLLCISENALAETTKSYFSEGTFVRRMDPSYSLSGKKYINYGYNTLSVAAALDQGEKSESEYYVLLDNTEVGAQYQSCQLAGIFERNNNILTFSNRYQKLECDLKIIFDQKVIRFIDPKHTCLQFCNNSTLDGITFTYQKKISNRILNKKSKR